MAVFSKEAQLSKEQRTMADNSALKFDKGLKGARQKAMAYRQGYDPRTGKKMTGAGKYVSAFLGSSSPTMIAETAIQGKWLEGQMKKTGGARHDSKDQQEVRKTAFGIHDKIGGAVLKAFGINVDGQQIMESLTKDTNERQAKKLRAGESTLAQNYRNDTAVDRSGFSSSEENIGVGMDAASPLEPMSATDNGGMVDPNMKTVVNPVATSGSVYTTNPDGTKTVGETNPVLKNGGKMKYFGAGGETETEKEKLTKAIETSGGDKKIASSLVEMVNELYGQADKELYDDPAYKKITSFVKDKPEEFQAMLTRVGYTAGKTVNDIDPKLLVKELKGTLKIDKDLAKGAVSKMGLNWLEEGAANAAIGMFFKNGGKLAQGTRTKGRVSYDTGGITKGKFSHKDNPLTVVDKDGKSTGMELTGEEFVFDKQAGNTIEKLSASGQFGKLGKFIKAEMETWENTGGHASGGLDLGASVGYLESVNGFENAGKGSLAIGYDTTGGTSYGTIQIASKTGAMKQFKKYLEVLSTDGDENAKAILKEINTISDAKWNTGSKKGDAVTLWNKIAETYNADDIDGNKLVDFEKGFADKKYTQPVLDWYTKKYSIDESEISDSTKAMIASRSIQHGVNGSQRVIENALGDDISDLNEDEVISAVYDEVHDNVDKYFKNSDPSVQSSIEQRMIDEKKVVLKGVAVSGSRVLPANATKEQKALFDKTQREEQFSSPARIKIDAAIKKYKKEQEKYREDNKEYIDVDLDARELKSAIADENILAGYDDIESMQAEYNKLNDRKIELYGKAASEKNEDVLVMKEELIADFEEFKIELKAARDNKENPMSYDDYIDNVNQINEYTSRLNTHVKTTGENLKIYTDYTSKEAEFTLSDKEMAEMDAIYLDNPTLGVTAETRDDLMNRLQKDKDKQESLLRNMLGEDDEGNPRDIDALLAAAEAKYKDGTGSSGDVKQLRAQKQKIDDLKERVDVTTKTLSQQEYLYSKDEAYQNQKNVTEDGKSIDYSISQFSLDYDSEYGLNYTTEEKETADELLAQYEAEQKDDAKYDFLNDDVDETTKQAPTPIMTSEEVARLQRENWDTAKATGIDKAIASFGGVDGALSLVGMAAGYKAATNPVPNQRKSEAWIEQMQRTKDRMNLGLDPNTKTMYQREAERTYSYDAANIGRMATSGQSALSALGTASSRKYDADLKLASMDATVREQHFGDYQSALVRDEAMTQAMWERNDYNEASRKRDLKAGLIGQSVKNIRDNAMYEKSYGDGSAYSQLMRAKLAETKATNKATHNAMLLNVTDENTMAEAAKINANYSEEEQSVDNGTGNTIADLINKVGSKFNKNR